MALHYSVMGTASKPINKQAISVVSFFFRGIWSLKSTQIVLSFVAAYRDMPNDFRNGKIEKS
jgi:hypothetical protein